VPVHTEPLSSQFQYGAMYNGLFLVGRRLAASARIHKLEPLTLNSSGGCGYFLPLSFFNMASPPRSLKNMTICPAGFHQTIVSAVRTRTRSGRISVGVDWPRSFIRCASIWGVTR